MAIHVAQMTSFDAMRACFAAVTTAPAAILHLDGYGLAPGCFADLVVLDAADPIDAIRTKAARLQVLRRGKTIASARPRSARASTCPAAPREVGRSRPMTG